MESTGAPRLYTKLTAGKSMPRDAAGVASSMDVALSRNACIACASAGLGTFLVVVYSVYSNVNSGHISKEQLHVLRSTFIKYDGDRNGALNPLESEEHHVLPAKEGISTAKVANAIHEQIRAMNQH